MSRLPQTLARLPFKEAKQQILGQLERHYLDGLFSVHGKNISAASRASGLSRRHLRTLYQKHGLR